MAICKCKMCGGDLHIEETDKVVEYKTSLKNSLNNNLNNNREES